MNFLNDSIAFYEIDNDYIEYLYQVDSNVYYHPSYRATIKPYVGILVDIGNIKYFIPLTSAKEKHKEQRMQSRDYLMIYDLVDKNSNEKNAIYRDHPNLLDKKYHILAVLDIRKMIPVVEGAYKKIEFKTLELNYQFLFYKEHEFCKSKQDKIILDASKIYSKTIAKGSALSKFHCDYVALEKALQNYK
ncbi:MULTISPECIES: type III toxin-antitoxin system ToxN/AbiQ family toxin [Streptococcus]|uniref:Type III toxin-antitoxin system ToxN/AbiQ family toxin n=1 Tax=Streptococcus lactarius TaxID=684066 RepID=A0A9X0WLP7_9STRE|nr:type III toxin-antitoxin system ToxN/AbiQ family toxin [Streptococcus lactarius]MBK4778725.1 hypothetical protein [Streptococcus lactarius]QUB39795.1 type III toxin-antitoxin system ToxN/AbiQ family toxin [Streptococcus lactarius]